MPHACRPDIARAASRAGANPRRGTHGPGAGSRRPTRSCAPCAVLSEGRNAEDQHRCESQRPSEPIFLHRIFLLILSLLEPDMTILVARESKKKHEGTYPNVDPGDRSRYEPG